jgi:alpha-L-fucosidase 2
MSKLTRREFVAGVSALACASEMDAQPQQRGELVLWFKKPADKWTDALPIGNGRLGAMVFGGVREERLQLNEDTLWSGAPRDWNNPDALKHLPEVRRLALEEQDYVGADKVCRQMQGPFAEAYQPLGDLHIKLDHGDEVSDYRRELDLDTGIARTSYRIGEAQYVREAFVSAVDQVIVVRMTTTAEAGLKFTVAIDSPQLRAKSVGGDGDLTCGSPEKRRRMLCTLPKVRTTRCTTTIPKAKACASRRRCAWSTEARSRRRC